MHRERTNGFSWPPNARCSASVRDVRLARALALMAGLAFDRRVDAILPFAADSTSTFSSASERDVAEGDDIGHAPLQREQAAAFRRVVGPGFAAAQRNAIRRRQILKTKAAAPEDVRFGRIGEKYRNEPPVLT